jgi:hypothetical protein
MVNAVEDERGGGMNSTISLVIAVLVIILLIVLILQFV